MDIFPLGLFVLVALPAAWVLDKTLPWLDRKLEKRKIKLGPWTIYKESPYLGSHWILSTRTHGYLLKNVAGNIWVIFVFTVAGLFIAYLYAFTR
jgi:hypothetical protein